MSPRAFPPPSENDRMILSRLFRRSTVAVCAAVALFSKTARADDWPQWLGPKRDGVWREDGVLERFPAGGAKVLWRTPIGSGYAGPAVAGGRVYVTDRVLKSGLRNPADGFARSALAGAERVLCLDEANGQILWHHDYDREYRIAYPAGPRTTPVVAGGKVYTQGAMGDLLCLDADSGKPVWSHNFVTEYNASPQTWGFSAHPLLDGDRLICLVGGDGTTVVAFHKDSGKELWRNLSSANAGYSPPVIFQVGATRQLIVWHAEAVCGLEPETGKKLWEVEFPVKNALTVPMPRYADGKLLVISFYNGAMMLKLAADRPAAEVLWHGKHEGERPNQTETINSIIPTPILTDEYIYGVCSYGQLRCLKADTGERVWATMEATRAKKNGQMVPSLPEPIQTPAAISERWSNAFLIPNGGRYFLFNEKGDLIIAKLSPEGYQEIDRTHVIEPDNVMSGRPVVWSHPAFADRKIFVRNDHEIVCVSLAK
jgi:outer membrane protein assembly factor BamB